MHAAGTHAGAALCSGWHSATMVGIFLRVPLSRAVLIARTGDAMGWLAGAKLSPGALAVADAGIAWCCRWHSGSLIPIRSSF